MNKENEKSTKETQTSKQTNLDFPPWLQEKRFDSNPLNFINTVRRKLEEAVNTPKKNVDIGIQNSMAFPARNKEESLQNLQQNFKKSELKSLLSHRCLDLDQKTIENVELLPKTFNNRNFTSTIQSETESELDTSKNIPEISSESGTSLKKNAEYVKQNGNLGLDADRLSNMKLVGHSINKDTYGVMPKETLLSVSPSRRGARKKVHKSKSDDLQPENARNKSENTPQQYSSDFPSTITENSKSRSRFEKTNCDILTDPKIDLYSRIHLNGENTEHSSITIRRHRDTISPIEINGYRSVSEEIRTATSGNGNVSTDSNVSTERRTIQSNSKATSKSSDVAESEQQKTETPRSGASRFRAGDKTRSDSRLKTETAQRETNRLQIGDRWNSDSRLNITTSRGIGTPCESLVPSLREPSISLALSNNRFDETVNRREDRSSVMRNISVRTNKSKITSSVSGIVFINFVFK